MRNRRANRQYSTDLLGYFSVALSSLVSSTTQPFFGSSADHVASVLVAPSDAAFARDVMQLQVQAVHRAVRLFDQPEEFAVLVEPLRLKSPSASEQETEHRLNQVAERSSKLWVKVD